MNKTLNSGERQVAPTVDGVRRDHVARYEWAAAELPPGSNVIDLACGIGYGTKLLADQGHNVLGLDNSDEAIEFARAHYAADGARFAGFNADREDVGLPAAEAVVCFETIEHLRDPRPALRAMRAVPLLLVSVPNEDGFPFTGQPFHFRHYTRAQFEGLLIETGWRVVGWYGQADHESEVRSGAEREDRTLIAKAMRE